MCFVADASVLAEKSGLVRAYSTLPTFALCVVVAVVLIWFALGQYQRNLRNTAGSYVQIQHPWFGGVLIITAVFIISNHLLVRGIGAGIWDADGQFLPYQVFVADHIRTGKLVSWDPFSNGGLPL